MKIDTTTYKEINRPMYILEEARLRNNLRIISDVAKRADVEIILAFKAYALWKTFPIFREYINSTTASSLSETRLAFDKFGSKAHTFSPAYTDYEIDEIAACSSHLTFNSLTQYERLHERARKQNPEISFGLRINPEYSEIETDIYNPCAPGTRFGVSADKLPEQLPEEIDGFHCHCHCENGSDVFVRTLAHIEEKFAGWFKQIKWINFGGGHLMTRKDYDIELLVNTLREFHNRYPWLKVIMEPGSAFGWQTGPLVAQVIDVVEDKGIKTAILNVSFSCHMPDCLEMPYHPAVRGAKTIEENMVLDKAGNVFCIDGLKGVLGNSQMDVEELFKENDKEKGRLAGSIKEKDEKDEPTEEEREENKDDEQKQAEKDLSSEGQDLKLSCFRKITDPHLQERMPSVFENSSEYAVAYSDTMSSFVILQKSTEIGENGDKVEKWKINESVQRSGTNYEPIISVNANGNELKQKVPMTILPVENVPNQKIAITMDPENYGKIDMETVTVMTCGKELAGHKEMLGRTTGLEGEGNINGDGVEDYELRQRLDRSGKDITGNPTAQDELIHGAKKVMKEKDQTENGVIADEETEIPETNLTYKDLKDVTGKTVEELVEEQGDEKSIIDIAKEVENKIKVAARECNVSVEGHVKELKKADGKDIDEKIANANEEIEGQYMGNNPRQH